MTVSVSAARLPIRPLTRSELLDGLRAAVVPFLVSRTLVWLGTEFGARLIPWKSVPYSSGLAPQPALVPFLHWDADYYASIVRYGYAAAPAGVNPPSYRAAFFPLYPLLVRLAGGTDWAMLLIPNLCFLIALALLYMLATRTFDVERAQVTLWVVSLGPAAMFFSYPYTESLFLLLCVAAFLLMETGHWVIAGLAGLGAATTRFPGVLVGAVLAAEAIIQRRVAIAGASLLPVAGLVVVSAVDWSQMGDPLGFLHAQSLWVGPPRSLLHIIGSFPKAILDGNYFRPEALGFPVLVAFAIAAVWVAFRMSPAYGLFAVTMVLLAGLQGWNLHFLVSVPRYLSVVFPCYFAFATLLAGRRNLQLGWLLISASIMLVFSALYGAWQFIG